MYHTDSRYLKGTYKLKLCLMMTTAVCGVTRQAGNAERFCAAFAALSLPSLLAKLSMSGRGHGQGHGHGRRRGRGHGVQSVGAVLQI